MPWYNGDYPPSYKNQPAILRKKAVEIANELLEHGTAEGIAIATGLKRARQYFADKAEVKMLSAGGVGKRRALTDEKAFPLSIEYAGKHYDGEILPSEEMGPNGTPLYFRVTLESDFFAYVTCGEYGWKDRDDSGKPKGLIAAIGNYIFDYYE